MTKTFKNPIGKKLDFLSGYQMVGGIIGLIFMTYLFFNLDEVNLLYILILGFGIVFYLFSFMTGLFLFQRKTYGLKLSLINQILQVIGFSFLGYAFEFVAGISFDVFFRFTNGFDVGSNIGLSNWHILINNDAGVQEFSINLVAVFLVLFILKLFKDCKTESSTNEIGTIGT